MKKKHKIIIAIFGLIASTLAIDVSISGSIYHPLTYIYYLASWLGCNKTSAFYCRGSGSAHSPRLQPGRNGAVVTTHHKASQVGLQILQQGGNAVDAAVAVGYALAVTDPCCGNIGGGGFMLIRFANGKNTFLNFREQAPLAARQNMYLDRQGRVVSKLSKEGYLAVAVPGTVKGLEQALSQYGTMSRATVMAGAIALAEKGFVLQSGDVEILNSHLGQFQAQPNVAAIFLKHGKTPYQVGDRLVQKDLAQTLKLLAKGGADGFYRGAIASEIVKASNKNGGILTLEDFTNYKVAQRQPLSCNYRGYEVISAPPPGGGVTLCQMLNVLEGYHLKQLGWHSTTSLHLMFEAMLHAYGDRNTYLGDPAFVNNPTQQLLSKEYAARIRRQISTTRATPPQQVYSRITSSREGTNTTHYSVVDRHGNAVSVTYTINSYFGAGVIAPRTGFFLNNEMDDFAAKPGVPNQFGLVQGNANAIAPGKRPLSSMSPTIVTRNGKTVMVTGSPGGSTIPTTVLQVLTNAIDYGMKLDKAVNTPRVHYQGLPNFVITEPYTLNSSVFQKLWGMGYRVVPFGSWGAAQSIAVDPQTNLLYGASDSRRSTGKALTY
ncbi:gamma-glutamyltransferase [cyanobacterium TDX16]|nr:gamma-glutamyltransferase [cyanobacterium TDX16]